MKQRIELFYFIFCIRTSWSTTRLIFLFLLGLIGAVDISILMMFTRFVLVNLLFRVSFFLYASNVVLKHSMNLWHVCFFSFCSGNSNQFLKIFFFSFLSYVDLSWSCNLASFLMSWLSGNLLLCSCIQTFLNNFIVYVWNCYRHPLLFDLIVFRTQG